MAYPFNEDHDMIREAARGWLSDIYADGKGPEKQAERDTFDLAPWRGFAVDQGFAGISIDEKYGGAGLGLLGRAVIMEEIGYTLFSSPFLSTCCLSADLLSAFASKQIKQDLLSKIASGDLVVALADGRSSASLADASLTGAIAQVVDAPSADLFLILIKESNTISIIAVSADTQGLEVTALQSIDPTRDIGRLELAIDGPGNWEAIASVDEKDFERIYNIAIGCIGAECVGGAQRCLNMTLDYAAQRVQFDRPIASFQAVKHRCADMFTALETSRSAAYWAASADADDQLEAALIARAWCSESFFKIAGDAIQLHGGIGFTWEYPLHYFFKRARANKSIFGTPGLAYDHLGDLIGLEVTS